MKDNSKMIYIMDMEDTYILMVTFIQETGLMERDQVGENQLINLGKFMKECGVIVNSWVVENSFLLSNFIKMLFRNFHFNIFLLIVFILNQDYLILIIKL